jgi:hypothetical protein
MQATPAQEMSIRIDSIDQLFNAPDLNPFSDKEIDVLGEPALMRVVKRKLTHGMRNWKETRLVIKLPADQITPDLQVQTTQAIRRFCAAKIEDNDLQIHVSRFRGFVSLIIVFIAAVILFSVLTILGSTVLANVGQTVQAVVAGFVCVLVWVFFWDPLESLVFEWVTPALQNRILRKLAMLEIIIEAQT